MEFLIILFVALASACLTHFLNYCIGKPGSKEFSPYEIFSSYTVWISKKRLERIDLYKKYAKEYNENIKRTESKAQVIAMQNDFKKMLYDAAEPFFTWERAAGMCPVCFGFWVSLLSGLVFTKNIIHLLIIIVISHVTIRLLSKIL